MRQATFWHAANNVCLHVVRQAYHDAWDTALTVRQYYYRLLSSGALKVDPALPQSKGQAYQFVCRLLGAARDNGDIPWYMIVDNGRRANIYYPDKGIDTYMHGKAAGGFELDPWVTQEVRPIIIIEKDGLLDVVIEIVKDWRIPVYVGQGFMSRTRSKQLADHLSDGRRYHAFYIGDFDPSGEAIEEVLRERLRSYGVQVPAWERITVTYQDSQILPSYAAVEIDTKDPRAAKFIAKYPGSYGYEVESLSPADLQQKVQRAIRPLVNQQQFDVAVQLEQQVNLELERLLPDALQNVVGNIRLLPGYEIEGQRRLLGLDEETG
jgi:hypothetical protein